jgi:hypothetical protein
VTKAEYPGDTDGDALRRVRDSGSNMAKPMDIDFAVAVSSQTVAEEIAKQIGREGIERMCSRTRSQGHGRVIARVGWSPNMMRSSLLRRSSTPSVSLLVGTRMAGARLETSRSHDTKCCVSQITPGLADATLW